MKKLSKILILTTTLGMGLSSVVNTSAMTKEWGTRWWTLDEMNETISEMEEIATERCGEDGLCKRDVYRELMASDGKYNAANLASGMGIVISAVNPGESTVKVIYQGRTSLKWRSNGAGQTTPKELYMMWVEPEMVSVTQQEATLLEYIKADEAAEGIHLIYQANEEKNVVPEIDTEMEIAVPGDLRENLRGVIDYSEKNDVSGSWGSVKYSDCMTRAGYEDGVECRIMFSEYGDYSYFPVVEEVKKDDEAETGGEEEGATEEESATEEEEKNEDVEDAEKGDDEKEEKEEGRGGMNDEAGEIEKEDKEEEVNNKENDKKEILAPETGYKNNGVVVATGGCAVGLGLAFLALVGGLKKHQKR